MQINGVDHVAIGTEDVEGSVQFYGHLLGFERALSPIEKAGGMGAWLLDGPAVGTLPEALRC